MAKDKQERIQELLNPREMVMYESVMHPWIFTLPIFFGVLGLVIVFFTSDSMLKYIPQEAWEIAGDWIYGAKETFLGFWMMGVSMMFIVRFYLEMKHLIQIVTNQRVVQVAGALTTKQHEIGLHHIKVVKVRHGHIINRLLHRGDVTIIHQKKGEEKIECKGVSGVKEFVEHIRIMQERFSDALVVQERAKKEQNRH